MSWAELCQCPYHLLLSKVQEVGGGQEQERETKVGWELGLKAAIIPVQSEEASPEGVGVRHWKGYHDYRGFIRMNKSLIYMAPWRCPKETK